MDYTRRDFGKLVIYPMREFADGTQLVNWNVEVYSKEAGPNAWNKNGNVDIIDMSFAANAQGTCPAQGGVTIVQENDGETP